MKRFLVLLAVALLCACTVERSPAPAPVPVPLPDQIRAIGEWFLWLGGIVAGLGMVAMVVARVGAAAYLAAIPFVGAILAGAASAIASGGLTAFALGCGFIILADYLWWVVAIAVLGILAWGWFHRGDLRRMFLAWQEVGKRKMTCH
jgi:hypothetical protein